jgi:membrane protein
VAFYTLFSMTPILVLTIAVAGYFFGAEAAQGEIIVQMQALVGPNGAQAINAVLAAARNSESWGYRLDHCHAPTATGGHQRIR